jgi:hypothetical protein
MVRAVSAHKLHHNAITPSSVGPASSGTIGAGSFAGLIERRPIRSTIGHGEARDL